MAWPTVVSPEQIIRWANRIPSLRTWDENHRKNELNEQQKGNTPRRRWDGGQGAIPATLLLRRCLEPKTCSLGLGQSSRDYFPKSSFSFRAVQWTCLQLPSFLDSWVRSYSPPQPRLTAKPLFLWESLQFLFTMEIMKGTWHSTQCVPKDSFIHSLFSFLPPFFPHFLQPILTKHLLRGCFGSFIEVQLIYSVVLISAVQQSDSVIHIHIRSFLYSFPLWFISGYCISSIAWFLCSTAWVFWWDLWMPLEVFLPCVKHCVRYLECTDEQDKQDPCFHRAFSLVEELKCKKKKVIKQCALGAIRKLTFGRGPPKRSDVGLPWCRSG